MFGEKLENYTQLAYALAALLTAFTVAYFAIPSVINVAKVKHLFDEPGERASHTTKIPTLGGFGIFAGLIFALSLFIPFGDYPQYKFLLGALIIIFLVGAKDDIIPMSPGKKAIGQLLAALILVILGGVRLNSLDGILGIEELPSWVGVLFSLIIFLAITNSINLIDGINGLSGSIGIITSLFFGVYFFWVGEWGLAIIASALIGSLIAFLKYNITPAKIFMGDTGSLIIGLLCSFFAINFIEVSRGNPQVVSSGIGVAVAVLIVPVFDTLRVLITRMLKGKSPFYPDRTHIHHLLLDFGLSHMKATTVLAIVNIGFIGLALALQGRISSFAMLVIVLALAGIMSGLLFFVVRKKQEVSEIKDYKFQLDLDQKTVAKNGAASSKEGVKTATPH